MKKIITIIAIIFFFIGCAAKKTIKESETKIVRDTIYKTKTIKEVERYTDTLTINKPCDSLGNLKPFNQIIKVKQGSITLSSINNKIQGKVDLNGYKNTTEKTYKNKYEKLLKSSDEVTVKYKTPFSIILILIGSLFLNILLIKFK